MFCAGDKIIYGSVGLCEIKEITKKEFGGKISDYYILVPIYKAYSTVYVPLDSMVLCEKMRLLCSKYEIEKLFECFDDLVFKWDDNKFMRRESLLKTIEFGTISDIFAIYKAIGEQKELLGKSGKRLNQFDERIFFDSQKIIEDVTAYVFDLSIDDAKAFIKTKVEQKIIK